MKAALKRAIVFSVLVSWAVALSAPIISTTASAASVSGTWESRIPGEGYMQTYMGMYGSLVTDYFDVELALSESGGTYYGTLRSWNSAGSQEHSAWGTLSDSVFYLTVDFGWDGVNYLTPVYTLTIDGNQMYGSGSYVNVGVTITGTFDLEKEGLFGVGGITPVVSAVSITVAIVAIVIASTPGKVPKTGRQPAVTRVQPPPPRYEPSMQRTTETPAKPISGDGTVPVGGVGLGPGQPNVPPPPTSRPLPPREHYSMVSQEPPRCPFHNSVALTPHFTPDMGNPGSWYCPMCKGYPWGKT